MKFDVQESNLLIEPIPSTISSIFPVCLRFIVRILQIVLQKSKQNLFSISYYYLFFKTYFRGTKEKTTPASEHDVESICKSENLQ